MESGNNYRELHGPLRLPAQNWVRTTGHVDTRGGLILQGALQGHPMEERSDVMLCTMAGNWIRSC